MMENALLMGSIPLWALVLIMVWTIPWKGVALWRSARNGHMIWFVALLLVNTIAILEIIYIFGFSKKKMPAVQVKAKPAKTTKCKRKR